MLSSVGVRVENVAQAVAEEVGGQHDERDGEARNDDQIGRLHHVLARTGEHGAPFRRWRLDAEAEEAQARGRQDRKADAHGVADDQDAADIRQHMAEHDAEVAGVNALGRLDVILVHDGQGRAAGCSGVGRDGGDADRHDAVEHGAAEERGWKLPMPLFLI